MSGQETDSHNHYIFYHKSLYQRLQNAADFGIRLQAAGGT